MDVDEDKLRNGIQNSIDLDLNIDELVKSASEYTIDYIKVSNRDWTIIFNQNYEMVDAWGNATTIEPTNNDCEV